MNRNRRVRRLRNIWLSSLRMMAKIRSLISGQLLSHFALRRPEDQKGESQQEEHLSPQDTHAYTLQKNASDNGDEIARRHHVRDHLDRHGHVLDGIKKSR